MPEQTLEEQLAALTSEERDAVEKAAAERVQYDGRQLALFDVRQDGVLSDPRDLGPVGGSHV